MTKLTTKRRAWLEHLRDHGPDVSHSKVGYACRSAGWSEWFVYLDDGRSMPISHLYAMFPENEQYKAWELCTKPTDHECITSAGRAALSLEQGETAP